MYMILFSLVMTTLFFYSFEDINSKINIMNGELNEVSNWFKVNKLSVNASKTNYMILGTPHMVSMKTLNKLKVA